MSIAMIKQSAASVPTPPAGEETIFMDAADDKFKKKISTGAVVLLEDAGGINQLTGEVLAGPGGGSLPATIVNSAVIAKVLTGLAESYGLVTSSDSILQAFAKLVWTQSLQAQDINANLTIPANYNLVRGLTRLKGASVLTIDNGAVLKLI